MLRVVQNGENRLDIVLSGRLDARDMKAGLKALVDGSKEIKNGTMLYEILDINFPSLGAIGVEFSMLPEMFKLIGKFDRIAVLTDKAWLQKASEVEGFLIPGLDIKAFDSDERQEAESWLLKA